MENKPKMANYRNAEFIQFIRDMITIYSQNNPSELKLDKFLNPVAELLPRVDDVFERDKKSINTNTLESLDLRRDMAITGIRTACEAYQKHFRSNVIEAANLAIQLQFFQTCIDKTLVYQLFSRKIQSYI